MCTLKFLFDSKVPENKELSIPITMIVKGLNQLTMKRI